MNTKADRNEWFRRKSWTGEDRAEFFSRLKRARGVSSKAQYLRIQAYHLQKANNLSAALELLDYMFKEFPEKTELAAAYLQRAQCLEVLGQISDAIQAFRDSLTAEHHYPNVKTNASLDFGMFVVSHKRTDLYEEIARIVKEPTDSIVFPYQEYQYHVIQAVVEQTNGNLSDARQHAEQAILANEKEHSGLRYHTKVGLVNKIDPKIEQLLKQILAT